MTRNSTIRASKVLATTVLTTESSLKKAGMYVLAVFLGAAMTATVSVAQTTNEAASYIDSSTSSVRFFLGSDKDTDPVNVGVARVQGTVNLDTTEPDRSQVDLAIYPAGEDWGASLNSEADLPSAYVPDVTDHTLLVFRSTQVSKASDGSFHVRGNLSLTRVERSIEADPNEAYAGPIYGEPVLQTVTQEVVYVFSNAAAQKNSVNELKASTRIVHEDFPELSTTIEQTNWPDVIANEVCEVPSTIGEDYSGVKCTGTEIASINANNCHEPASVGEDYHGLACDPPAGDLTTIALDLKLTNSNAIALAETPSRKSAVQ